MDGIPHVQIMGRDHCCLCDEVATLVAECAKRSLCTWEKVDVDSDEVLSRRYGLDVPVLLIDGEVCFRHRVDASELGKMLHFYRLEQPGAAIC